MWRALQWMLISISLSTAGGYSRSISLDEPFQWRFRNLPHAACVTLYHRNGRFGCGTYEREVQKGPIIYYDGSGSNQINPQSKFVAMIEENALSSDTINALLQYNSYSNLKGILVLNSTNSHNDDDYISSGYQYPLGYGTPSGSLTYGNNQFPWNGNGDGLILKDLFGVPMVYVKGYEASSYLRQVGQDSSKAAKIVAEFNYYMGPDGVTSADCLSWRDAEDNRWAPKCLPLGGTSVWAHAGSPPQYGGNQRRLDDAGYNGGGDGRAAVIIGTSIDATAMFHDLAAGANTAASNTLSLMMAAYLLGQSVSDATLDALTNRIIFGFFQGETYGYLGSRSFLRDVMGFQCGDGLIVPSVANDKNSEKACLYPLRPSLRFMDIGTVAGMLTVDQVGVPLADGVLYTHNDGDGGMGTFLAKVLKYSSTNYYSIVASAAEGDDGDYPYPPSPLTALQSLSEGGIGGTVLSGYDYVFAKRPPYQSHMNRQQNREMNLKTIAASSTLLARAALAAAYDDGSYDYETSAQYAANIIPELEYDDEVLVELADCLLLNGNCGMLKKYAQMEANNEQKRTGWDVSVGESLGAPPSYYVGVYDISRGQPFAMVGNNRYGAYNGNKYGKKNTDAVLSQPKALEQALRNMLHDFLGRGTVNDASSLKSCRKQSDCSGVSYCSSNGDSATCSGSKVCVCTRAHYHHALDESIEPAVNNATGYFVASKYDEGLTPLYTEPFWSSDVGVKMYRSSGNSPGLATLGFGVVVCIVCFFSTLVLKVGMKKSKVY